MVILHGLLLSRLLIRRESSRYFHSSPKVTQVGCAFSIFGIMHYFYCSACYCTCVQSLHSYILIHPEAPSVAICLDVIHTLKSLVLIHPLSHKSPFSELHVLYHLQHSDNNDITHTSSSHYKQKAMSTTTLSLSKRKRVLVARAAPNPAEKVKKVSFVIV